MSTNGSITIDGPAGTSKTTTAALLGEHLAAYGHTVHRAQLPSRSDYRPCVSQALNGMGHAQTPALREGR